MPEILHSRETGGKKVQSQKFRLRQIVLGYLHIVAGHVVSFEVGHAHKRLFIVHTFIDEFRCRMLMHGIMHLVLHCNEKQLCYLCAWVVVGRCGIDISCLLVGISLTTADVADTLKQILEVSVALLYNYLNFSTLYFMS